MKLAVPKNHLGDQFVYKSSVGPIKNGVKAACQNQTQKWNSKWTEFWVLEAKE